MKNSGKHVISNMTRSIQIGITELLQQIENPKVIYDTFLSVQDYHKSFTFAIN
jgi:hypothetical protein